MPSPTSSDLGEGYGFRKIRKGLDVTAFGVNAIVIPPSYETGRHLHEEQEELYFVHSGRIAIEFGDGTSHELGPGGLARVDAATIRKIRNVSDSEDAVYLVVGRQGRLRRSRRQAATRRGESLRGQRSARVLAPVGRSPVVLWAN